MDNKVYYGEYTLEHWLKLILSGEIVLPEYQRAYVWKREQVEKLVDTFNNKEFVPPVTIGAYQTESSQFNIILDGQQRLTSILLYYIGYFPNSNFDDWRDNSAYADTNDDDVEIEDDILIWNFNKLLELGKTKKVICKKIEEENKEKYIKLQEESDESFFKENYLGFSYLVPKIKTQNNFAKMQTKFYSSVFRNINIQGTVLSPQESRRSLYFLNKDLEKYFDPNIFKAYTVKDKKLDFTRYLALLENYQSNGIDSVGRGFGNKLELLYENFVYSKAEETEFDFIIPLNTLKNTMKKIDIPKNYDSIIDADMYLFGLIYFTMFRNKELENFNTRVIQNFINYIKSSESENKHYVDLPYEKSYSPYLHQKNPNALKYLRFRLQQSINIYEELINDKT